MDSTVTKLTGSGVLQIGRDNPGEMDVLLLSSLATLHTESTDLVLKVHTCVYMYMLYICYKTYLTIYMYIHNIYKSK